MQSVTEIAYAVNRFKKYEMFTDKQWNNWYEQTVRPYWLEQKECKHKHDTFLKEEFGIYRDDFLEQFSNHIPWVPLCSNCIFDIETLCRLNEFDWINYSAQNNSMTEEILEEFKDKVAWSLVCQHQRLSIGFIVKMHDYIDFFYIFKCQDLSKKKLIYLKEKYVDPSFAAMRKRGIDISKYESYYDQCIKEAK